MKTRETKTNETRDSGHTVASVALSLKFTVKYSQCSFFEHTVTYAHPLWLLELAATVYPDITALHS